LKLVMTGLSHQNASLDIREKFAITKEKTKKILTSFKDKGVVSGCVIIGTCNRTEVYASIPDDIDLLFSPQLCDALGLDFSVYQHYLIARTGTDVMEHLCRIASGLDSQVMGDDQIITQVREALELSRGQKCTDSAIEKLFNLSIHAAKIIKTNVLSGFPGENSVPQKTVEKLKELIALSGKTALVIGSGRIGRLVAEMLIRENARVTITMRSHNKGVSPIPDKADAIHYDERYSAVEKADIVISATTSPHLTLLYKDMYALKKRPEIIVDLAVPRDVESSISGLPGVTLLTIDDISGEERLSAQSIAMINSVIAEYIAKYNQWVEYRSK